MSRRGQISLKRPLDETIRRKFRPFSCQVGILQDGAHFAPSEGKLKSYAGGPARRQTRTPDGTLSVVSANVRRHLGFNYLTRPFRKRTAPRVKWANAFFKMVFSLSDGTGGIASKKKRCENLLQALVRNPILNGEYGSNKRATARRKGFNRKLIDTAQFFRAIKSRVRINVSR